MKVLTRQELANKAKDRWKTQYFVNGIWKYDDNKRIVYERLDGLDNNPLPEQVNEVIGNTSWTRLECSECNKEVDLVVVFQDSESDSYICKKCLNKALRLIKGTV